jgi:hypothetical protein
LQNIARFILYFTPHIKLLGIYGQIKQ